MPLVLPFVRGAVVAVFVLFATGGFVRGESLPPTIVGTKTEDASTVVLEIRADASVQPATDFHGFLVNGQETVSVGRSSATIYEDKRGRGGDMDYPQVILHQYFLRLKEPLREGQRYAIASPYGGADLTFNARATLCDAIKFNQVGYGAQARKRYAYYAPWFGEGIASNSATPPASYEVIELKKGRVAITGVPEACEPDDRVGGPAWRMDLSALTEPGSYRISIPGVGSSEPFEFGDAAMHHSFFVHMKGFYQQRCGVALRAPFTQWTREACHTELAITDAEPPNFIKEMGVGRLAHPGGGHHDAGDFDIRLVHTLVPGYLLNAYELFPAKFTDGQLVIPESGNRIPDILDEALFSIAAWELLQQPDGSIRAGWEADRHPTYGEVTAATDRLQYKTYRSYGHTTLEGGALMAYASRLVRPFDSKRADALLARARRAWAFYEGHQADAKYTWSAGARLYAACQLYLATGEASFHEAMQEPVEIVFGLNGKKAQFPAQYLGHVANLNYVNAGMVFTHFFMGYLLDPKIAKKPDLEKTFRTELLRQANDVLKVTERNGFPIYKLGDWGMSTATGRVADYLLNAYRLTGDAKYYDGAALLADWQLGANPSGRCFTTGLGWRPPYSPLHLDSYDTIQRGLGPVPGISIYGITNGVNAPPYVKAVTRNMYPPLEKMPAARRFTDGWSVVMQNEFTVWETMAPSAFLHACLAPDVPLRGQLLPMGEIRIPGGYPATRKNP